jgi:hypothetical protein
VAELQEYCAHHQPPENPLVGNLVGVTNVWNDLAAAQFHGPPDDVPASFLKQKFTALPFATNDLTGPVAFSTRDGLEGLLQVTGFLQNPPGVKVRYKLVQNATATTGISTQAKDYATELR